MDLKIQWDEEGPTNFAVSKEVTANLNRIAAAAKIAEMAAKRTSAARTALAPMEKQLADLQDRQKKSAWDRLSIEDKIVQLRTRAAKLDAAASKAGAGTALARGIAIKQQLTAAELQAYLNQQEGDRSGALKALLPAALVTRVETLQTMRSAGAFRGGGVLGLGAVALAGIYKATKAAVEDAAEIRSIAGRTTSTLSTAQAIRYGSGKAGIPIESMVDMLDEVRRSQGDALSGSKSAVDAFAALRVTSHDLKSMDVVGLFRKIADEFERGGRNAQQYSAAAALLGRQFKSFAPSVGMVGTGMGEMGAFEIPTTELDALGELGSLVKSVHAWWGGLFKRGAASIGAGVVNFGRRFKWMGMEATGAGTQEERDALLAKIGAIGSGVDISDDKVRKMQADLLAAQMRNKSTAISPFDMGLEEQQKALEAGSAGGRELSMRPASDALSRIGLFIGTTSQQTSLLQRQLDAQRSIVGEIKRLTQVVEADWPAS